MSGDPPVFTSSALSLPASRLPFASATVHHAISQHAIGRDGLALIIHVADRERRIAFAGKCILVDVERDPLR